MGDPGVSATAVTGGGVCGFKGACGSLITPLQEQGRGHAELAVMSFHGGWLQGQGSAGEI